MSDLLKRQYSILAQLRTLDEKAFRLDRDLERIPQASMKIKSGLGAFQADFQKYDEVYKANEKKLRSCESDLKERENKLEKAQAKLMECRSNEEFQAAQREIAAQKQVKSAIEDQILEMITFLEKEGANFKEKQSAMSAENAKVDSELAQLEKDAEAFRKQKQDLDVQRTALIHELDAETRALYQRGNAQTRGSGVAIAERGKCLGCNMQIRPQVYNEILGFRMVHRCSHCGRVLILQTPEDAEKAAAIVNAPALP